MVQTSGRIFSTYSIKIYELANQINEQKIENEWTLCKQKIFRKAFNPNFDILKNAFSWSKKDEKSSSDMN